MGHSRKLTEDNRKLWETHRKSQENTGNHKKIKGNYWSLHENHGRLWKISRKSPVITVKGIGVGWVGFPRSKFTIFPVLIYVIALNI